MKRDEFRLVLDVVSCGMYTLDEMFRIMYLDEDLPGASCEDSGFLPKMEKLDDLLHNNSSYADKTSDDFRKTSAYYEEYCDIVDSADISLDEKFDKLFEKENETNPEDYKTILDVFCTGYRAMTKISLLLLGKEKPYLSDDGNGLFNKIFNLCIIIKRYSIFKDEKDIKECEEFWNIINSTELSLDEKFDKIYEG